jgi:serine/threonine-protein kinase
MAEVYRAEQELTQGISRPVAVKVIRPEYSESSDFREMFLDEARTACTVSHPNIAQIYDVGESDEGLLYMAMELVPGETLAAINRTLRASDERFSDEALFAIGIWTASALEAVHALTTAGGAVGLVHRDVSPHNLLLSATGSLKLIDFGISKAATNRNLTLPGVTKGKAGYFSPEQAMGKRLDGRSDLFSLGVTLYKLASGATPFDDHKSHGERHAALVRGQWKDLAEVFPGLSDPFYEVVRRSLMLQPEDRYQTARELREALERAAFDGGFRVGQSSLLGYVDTDGEITASGGTRSSAYPALTATPSGSGSTPTPSGSTPRPKVATPPPAASVSLPAPNGPTGRHHTERVPAARVSPEPHRRWLIVSFFAAVVVGVSGTVLVLSESNRAEEVVAAEPAPSAAVEVDHPRPLEPLKAVRTDIKAPDVDLILAPKAEPVRPDVKRPPRLKTPEIAKSVLPKGDPPKPSVVAPSVEESIPDGIGTIRISVVGDSAAKVVVRGVRVYEQGQPFNEKVPSGMYTVMVRLADGRLSPQWRGAVRPEQQRKLSYDATQGRWNEL